MITTKRTILVILLSVFTGIAYGQAPEPSQFTKEKNAEVKKSLPFADKQDFEDATRGFIATIESGVILNDDGTPSFSMKAWDFLKEPEAETANPSLWRQGQLNSIHGLFEVVKDKIYQIRGFDMANMTFIKTNSGWIVIDPLETKSTAKAGYDLVKQHIEKGTAMPVHAILITHPHLDHYAGITGILENAPNRDIEIITPKDFFEHAVSENVMAGPAMQRRALYMYGMTLPIAPHGNIGCGLGQTNSTGFHALLPPTKEIDNSTEKLTIDGLDLEFIYVKDTEAPVEMMIYFPQLKAFCVAEDMNRLLHNLLTLRGAKVRNGQVWSKAIDKALMLCGDEVEYSFSTHNWPTWDNKNIVTYWEDQRDMYRYIHDQTLRLANLGYTPIEIAEMIELPETLANKFYSRGYYGTVSHDVKSQYQLYFGWFDGNPANLHALPPVDAGKKYVEAMGGEAKVIETGRKAYNEGDYRWCAMLLNHLVFANPDNKEGRNLLADAYTQLGYQAESGTWRNFYLSGAQELRYKPDTEKYAKIITLSPQEALANLNNMTIEMLFDYLGIKIDGKKAAADNGIINFTFNDQPVTDYTLILSNGALTHRTGSLHPKPTLSINTDKQTFGMFLLQPENLDKLIAGNKMKITGNQAFLQRFMALLNFDMVYFNIIEP